MFRSLNALALVIAVALPAAPARAQQIDAQQATQILGGLLALYGLKEALEDDDDDDDRRRLAREREVHEAQLRDREVLERRARAREAELRAARARLQEARDQRHRPGYRGQDGYAFDYRNGRDRDPGQPRHHIRARDVVAPDRCAIAFTTRNGPRLGYVRRCMVNSVPRPALLPQNCLREVETRQGLRRVYPRRCLSRAGWDVNGRR